MRSHIDMKPAKRGDAFAILCVCMLLVLAMPIPSAHAQADVLEALKQKLEKLRPKPQQQSRPPSQNPDQTAAPAPSPPATPQTDSPAVPATANNQTANMPVQASSSNGLPAPDVVGIKLGMSPTQVKQAIVAHDSTLKIVEAPARYWWSVTKQTVLSEILATKEPVEVNKSKKNDIIAVYFAHPPSPLVVIGYNRSTSFEFEPSTKANVIAALRGKYGQESYVSSVGSMHWYFDLNGSPVKKEPGECGYGPGVGEYSGRFAHQQEFYEREVQGAVAGPIDTVLKMQATVARICGITLSVRMGVDSTNPELVKGIYVSVADERQFYETTKLAAEYIIKLKNDRLKKDTNDAAQVKPKL